MTSAGQSGGEDPLKISEIETRLAQLKKANQGETNPYREVHANEISEIEASLAQLKKAKEALQGETKPVQVNETFEKGLSLVRGVSDIETRLYVLQTSQIRLRLAALMDVISDARVVVILCDHGSESFTDLDLESYNDLIKDKRLPFSKGWDVPGERKR